VPRPVVIDTDGGVDDAVALWWALRDPALDVRAITVVWGNVPVEIATDSVLRVVHAAGRDDVAVAVGDAGPIGPAPDLRPATFIHGDDGLGNAAGPRAPLAPVPDRAAAVLARAVHDAPGEVAVVTLGPLTNLARALRDDANLANAVGELIVMGGSARRGGNALPAGEANVAHDPGAAQEVVTAPWPVPPLLIGLDVTLVATLGPEEFALLAERRNAAAAFLDAPLRFYRTFGSTFTASGTTPCHDLLAVLALADPPIISDAPVLPLAVDTCGGPAWGTTVVDFRAPIFAKLEGSEQSLPDGFAPWRIALDADTRRFRERVRALFGG
jgi:purine nucleosidase